MILYNADHQSDRYFEDMIQDQISNTPPKNDNNFDEFQPSDDSPLLKGENEKDFTAVFDG